MRCLVTGEGCDSIATVSVNATGLKESIGKLFEATGLQVSSIPLTSPCFWHKNFGGIVRVSPQPNSLEPPSDINVPRKDRPDENSPDRSFANRLRAVACGELLRLPQKSLRGTRTSRSD